MNMMPDPDVLRRTGEIAFRLVQLDEACHCYRKALWCYKQSRDTLAQGFCLRRLGQIVLAKSYTVRNYGPSHRTKNSNDHRKLTVIAGQLFESAAGRYQRLGDEVGKADCVIGSAVAALEQCQMEQARRLFEQSLEVFLRHSECESKQADCLVGLADVARRQCSNEEAMWSYRDAEVLYAQDNRYDGRGNCHLQLGDIALERDRCGDADFHFQKAFNYYQKIHCTMGTMHVLHALGDMALRFESFDIAASNYARSADLANRHNLQFTVGLLCFKIACCLSRKSHRTTYFERSTDAWRSIGREDLIRLWLDGQV